VKKEKVRQQYSVCSGDGRAQSSQSPGRGGAGDRGKRAPPVSRSLTRIGHKFFHGREKQNPEEGRKREKEKRARNTDNHSNRRGRNCPHANSVSHKRGKVWLFASPREGLTTWQGEGAVACGLSLIFTKGRRGREQRGGKRGTKRGSWLTCQRVVKKNFHLAAVRMGYRSLNM